MHAQDFFASAHIRTAHYHSTIEAPRPQQSGIEHIGTVGGGHQDHAFVRLEAVHFNEQLIQRLLALVVPTAEACATMASDGIDFIDEDDAGSILLALLEQIAYATGPDADKHFHEVRTRDREERNVGFARNRAG